jgi:hypothetical protein
MVLRETFPAKVPPDIADGMALPPRTEISAGAWPPIPLPQGSPRIDKIYIEPWGIVCYWCMRKLFV